MKSTTKYVGLDVSKETMAVGVAELGTKPPRFLGTVPHTLDAARKLVKQLGGPENLVVCYEAGPTGYGLHRYLSQLGVTCFVVAPSLIPTRPGDHVKTDRRDALRLAQLLRAGELMPVWVPGEDDEALRDLVRARTAAKTDLKRARQRISSFLLRMGIESPTGVTRWKAKYILWLETLKFPHRGTHVAWQEYLYAEREAANRLERLGKEMHAWATDSIHAPVIRALQALRGVAEVTAVTLVSEVGKFSRFSNPVQLMAYAGLVPREYSSGARTRRGSITKTGNQHLRFALGEAAWSYRFRPAATAHIRKRHEGLEPEVLHIAMKAQQHLHRRYTGLVRRGKHANVAITAVARELLGFVWAIAVHVEAQEQAIVA